MALIRVSGPTTEPVDLTSVKAHLKVETADDDELIDTLIGVAREYVEQVAQRPLLTQAWDYFLQDWPRGDRIRLPYGNLQSVTSVSWKDETGAETTLTQGDDQDYVVENNGENDYSFVKLAYASTWPAGTLHPANPIRIRFICGWTSSVTIPLRFVHLIKMVCAKLYESRGEDTLGQTVHEDQVIQRLLNNERLRGEFA